jgi:DNA invertase Pin-like site-specific DNA recombinase
MKLQASHHGRDERHQAPPAVQTWSYRFDKAASYDSNLGNAELVIGSHAMNLGYARTSTVEQTAGLEAQERDLRAAGVDRIFAEQTSSIGGRPQLDAALDYLREGDVLTVSKLDRLARSVGDLCAIVKLIEGKGASLRILSMNLDTASPTGRLMLNVIGSVAQFEREVMLERQREGIAKAKGEGRYKGRKPTARAKADDIRRLAGEGMTREAIAAQLKIGVASVYRVLRAAA